MPFADIIGHQNVVRMLRTLTEQGRLPHALLFIGPEGIGKRFTALGLAKALLCEKGNHDFCDQCMSCRNILKGQHPDVMLIQPEGDSIKIEQIREWQKNIESKSYCGSWKITIVDQAERITHGAANSMLKALEEPPENTLILLITIEKRDLLPTIVSRCQVVRFSPLTRPDFISIIMKNRSLNENQASMIYNLSKGQVTLALSMDPEKLSQLRAQWRDLFRSPRYAEASFDQASLREGLEITTHWWRDIMLAQLGIGVQSLTNQDDMNAISEDARICSPAVTRYRINLLLQAMEALELNANPKLTFDSLMLQWDNMPS